MRPVLLFAALLILEGSLTAADPRYPRDPGNWREFAVPPGSPQEWQSNAEGSPLSWWVFARSRNPRATLVRPAHSKPPKGVSFQPFTLYCPGKVDPTFVTVDDGWIVSFNAGEWGGEVD